MKYFYLLPTHGNRLIIPLVILIWISFCGLPGMAAQRFVDNEDGTVTDTKTDLMWVSKDNGVPINWPDAIKYCINLRIGGYSDWRMPTLAELSSLFNPNEKNKNGYHINPLISTTAQSCWSADTRGYSAGRFNFKHGSEYWLRQAYSGPTRVLPVRNNQ